MPVLEDFSRVLAEPVMASDFPPELIRHVQRSLESAIEKFPIFARPTGSTSGGTGRVESTFRTWLSAQVAGGRAEQRAVLHDRAARLSIEDLRFCRGDREDGFSSGEAIRAEYVLYWRARYDEVAETPKRLCMDEYHLTGGVETIASR